jgi:hypothetical protein
VLALRVYTRKRQAVPAAVESIPLVLNCFADVLVLVLLRDGSTRFILLDALCVMVLWIAQRLGYGQWRALAYVCWFLQEVFLRGVQQQELQCRALVLLPSDDPCEGDRDGAVPHSWHLWKKVVQCLASAVAAGLLNLECAQLYGTPALYFHLLGCRLYRYTLSGASSGLLFVVVVESACFVDLRGPACCVKCQKASPVIHAIEAGLTAGVFW